MSHDLRLWLAGAVLLMWWRVGHVCRELLDVRRELFKVRQHLEGIQENTEKPPTGGPALPF